jgi:conjugal transfer mating pair stabilization protein TraN
MRANGLAGQAAGQAAAAGVAAPGLQGNALVLPGGQTLDVQALFPDSGGDAAAFSQWYGDDAAAVGNGRQAQGRLTNEASPSGNAYRALQQSVGRDRPDMGNDPLWRQTDLVNDGLDDLAQSFADCHNTVRFDQGERQVHLPDLRTCERVAESGNCAWFHDYSLPPASPFVTAWGGATVSDCGVGCAQVAYHHDNALVQYGKQYPPALPAQTFGFDVADQGRVNTVTVSVIPQDPAIQFETTRPDWPLRADKVVYQYLAAFPGYSYSAASPDVWEPISRPAIVGRDATVDLRSGGSFTILNNLQARNDGSDIWYSGSWTYDVTVTLYYTPVERPTLDWGWTENPQCTALLGQVQAGGCSGSVQCIGAPALAANGCYQDTGVQVCPGDLAQPPVAVSPFCREVRVSADCSTINTGPMDCWTDTQGTVQCPQNGGSTSNCAALENDPQCAFLREQCVEGGEKNGLCYVHELVWDCGALANLPTLDRTASLDCAGPVRCMGGDCLDPASEQSTDFAKAVAALQAVQMAVSDADCTDVANCQVFPGTAGQCKKAVAGIVNCCKTPGGVSLTDYLSLVMAVSKIDSAVMGMDKGSAIRGGWETLRQPLDSTWTAVKDGFTSVANNLMGQAAPQVNDALAKLSLEGFKQELMHATAQWAADTFGPSAVNALFAAETGGAAVGANGQVVSDALTLGGPLGTAMLYVMYAYIIYTIVMILIKIIWTCEKAEFELGAKRELKSCHQVGSYCQSKVLGWCIEKRESYCCFNTPLARIMNEQIRPQIGRSWGEAKNPECSGIAVADFARVDWNRVNLDEWLAILTQTGNFPTLDSLNLAALTGDGSALNTGGRLDAATRTLERSDGLDSGQIRQDAEDELWGQVNLGAGAP